jgi:hypothetical protein
MGGHRFGAAGGGGDPVTEEDPIARLAGERGRILGQLGVRPEDARWIEREAQTVASLVQPLRRRGAFSRLVHRLARKAARTAR